MQYGIWTPLPHTIRTEQRMESAVAGQKRDTDPHAEDAAFAFARDLVCRADQLGYDITLIAQRYLGPDLEAWTLAAALASLTKRIELMVAVHPGIITPQVVAKMGASLDRISRGRFAINLVNGWWREEFELFSNGAWYDDPEAKFGRMREFLAVVRGLWTDADLAHAGAHFQAHVRPALTGANGKVVVPDAGDIVARAAGGRAPKIYAASRSGPGKDVIAALGDVWFAQYQPGYRNYLANLALVGRDVADMKARAARHGRMLGFGLNPQVVLASTMAEAERIADAVEDPRARDRVSATLGAGLVGTPQVVAERILAYEAAGINCMMLRFTPMLEGLERFAAEVMPLVEAGRRAPVGSASSERAG